MNWGLRIIILYATFVVFMVILVGMSVQQDFDLVSKDYYNEEIEYQTRIDKIANAQKLATPLQIQLNNETEQLHIQYPADLENISGKIQLYRPTDSKKDVIVAVKPAEDHTQQINMAALQKGLWRVKVEWSAAGKEYYNEEIIVIQ
jgi:hypothetical protein